MKLFLTTIMITMSIAAFSQSTEIDKVRFLYFDAWDGDCGAEELVKYLDETNLDGDALMQAYKGAALATTANCEFLPWKKYKKFQEGKQYIESAVRMETGNIEVRFIRFTIQTNIPGFLNYDNLEEDKKILLESLVLQYSAGQQNELSARIFDYLMKSDEILPEDQKKLNILTAKG